MRLSIFFSKIRKLRILINIFISGLPPYINTKKSTKPLLQVASQKKLPRGYWVHFSLKNGRSAMLRRSAMLSR
ncbi:MAG: hypothetical protein ACKO90_24025, partial [Microcystis panniformis]